MSQDKIQKTLIKSWKEFCPHGAASFSLHVPISGGINILEKRLKKSQRFSFRLREKAEGFSSWAPQRQKQWCAARHVELDLEEALKTKDFLMSLTHTEELAVGLGLIQNIGFKKAVCGVGVDIERLDRKISKPATKRILLDGEGDLAPQLLPIDFWVLKEAGFKAQPRSDQKLVTDLKLKSWSEKKNEGELQTQRHLVKVKLLHIQNWSLGLAYSL